MRALSLALGRRARGAPDWGARPHRVLFARHDGIGDLIMSTGTIRAIATAFPTVRVDVLTTARNAAVVAGNPHVASVLTFTHGRRGAYPLSTIVQVRRRRYDAIVDGMIPRAVDGRRYHDRVKFNTAMLLLGSGAPARIGVGGRAHDDVYTIRVRPRDPGAHHVVVTASLAVPFGVDPATADLRPELHLSAAERDGAEAAWQAAGGDATTPRLLVNVSAGNDRKRWAPQRFAETLTILRRRHPVPRVIVIGTPADAEEVRAVARDAHAAPAVPGLREAFALVGAATVLLSPDTSLPHAAAALGVPSVVLMRAENAAYTPYRARGHVLVRDTLDALAPSDVAEAVARLLGSSARDAAAPVRDAQPRTTA